ncbi:MAG TPA: MerR family transcriptional regulator [Acidimicrobiales bacterium]|nr:MerR family transcriptional regulator [Acidimicrobiales bacterium]
MSFVETPAPPAALHGIGEAARLAGTSVRALRYYQEMGLVRPAALSPGGHRLYGPDELARVRRIRELQDLMGFNLAEIGELLRSEDRLDSLRDAYHRDDDPEHRLRIATEARAVLEELDGRVEAKLRRLEEFRAEIAERRARVDAALRSRP